MVGSGSEQGIYGYEGVRGLHPQSSLGIFGLPRVGMNEEQAEVLTTETGDQLVVARGET